MPKLLVNDFAGRFECGEGELPQGDREFRVYVGSVINIELPGGIILNPCKLRFEESAGSLSANEYYQKWKRNHGCERCDSLLKQICTKVDVL